MKIAAVQLQLESSKEINLEKVLEIIRSSDDCDLIVFPEMIMGGADESGGLSYLAEDVENGVFATAVRSAAAERRVNVCVTLWEDSGEERVFNTAMVFGDDGGIRAKYRKVHLFDALSVKESDRMIAGDSLPDIFEINGIKCSLGICYDLRFPEFFRHQVYNGAELFVLPAAWYAGENKIFHLKSLLAARAIENTSYIVCANLCGENFCGNSTMYDPFGVEIFTASNSESLIYAKINKDRIKDIRNILPSLDNFRKELF